MAAPLFLLIAGMNYKLSLVRIQPSMSRKTVQVTFQTVKNLIPGIQEAMQRCTRMKLNEVSVSSLCAMHPIDKITTMANVTMKLPVICSLDANTRSGVQKDIQKICYHIR